MVACAFAASLAVLVALQPGQPAAVGSPLETSCTVPLPPPERSCCPEGAALLHLHAASGMLQEQNRRGTCHFKRSQRWRKCAPHRQRRQHYSLTTQKTTDLQSVSAQSDYHMCDYTVHQTTHTPSHQHDGSTVSPPFHHISTIVHVTGHRTSVAVERKRGARDRWQTIPR